DLRDEEGREPTLPPLFRRAAVGTQTEDRAHRRDDVHRRRKEGTLDDRERPATVSVNREKGDEGREVRHRCERVRPGRFGVEDRDAEKHRQRWPDEEAELKA